MAPFHFLQNLVQQDVGIHDPGAKRMIISVLTAALVMDVLFVVMHINPEVMAVYGALLFAALLLAFRGHLVPARLAIPLGGLILFTYLMIINKGIRDIALLGLPVVIIAAGLLFGKLGTLIYGTLSAGVVLFLGITESRGILVSPYSSVNTSLDYVAATIAISIVAIMQWLVINRLNDNIRRAQYNEDSQKVANDALRLSEAKYKLLIDESPQGIIIADDDGLIDLINPFGCKLLGYEESELIGTYSLNLIDPDFLSQQPLPEDELRAGHIIQREGVMIRRNGERIHIMGGYRYMPDGRFQYIFQDISERKQAEAEREALIRELESKNAELEQFTYTVSHDLKSPLVTIRGFLGYLEKDALTGNQERMKKDIERIAESTDKMQTLLRELLELSRIGRLMNPSEALPFNAVVNEALKMVEGQLQAHNTHVDVMNDMPMVYGDHMRLVEVVQNLLDNAIKFSSKSDDPCIEVGFRRNDNEIVFYVHDNGIGIAPSFHERVFGLFNKLDPTAEGTGIGLTLVKRIVEVHGGRIWIESEGNGTGTTFCFTLANTINPASPQDID
jgi:two-component system, LuxR family, sensor kinase FixL